MRNTRRRDTPPEMAIRRLLHGQGFRYRVNYQPIPTLRRTADIAFIRTKVAVFIDGCFWHSCPLHGTLPKSNADWWQAKLQRNVDRDRDTDERLRNAGWTVIRIWEHEQPASAAGRVAEAVNQRRQLGPWSATAAIALLRGDSDE